MTTEMQKWLDTTIEMVRAGLATDATPEARAHGAAACLSLHAMLSPARVTPMPRVPEAPAEPDVFDIVMAKLEPYVRKDEPAFNPRILPTGK
jgi:hypothetical protein